MAEGERGDTDAQDDGVNTCIICSHPVMSSMKNYNVIQADVLLIHTMDVNYGTSSRIKVLL